MAHILVMRMEASYSDMETNLQTKVTSKYLVYVYVAYSLKMPNNHLSPPKLLLSSLRVDNFCRTQSALHRVKVLDRIL